MVQVHCQFSTNNESSHFQGLSVGRWWDVWDTEYFLVDDEFLFFTFV